MPRIHLVRHGHAAASWSDHLDPGLDATGTAEARAVGRALVAALDPQPIWSSPLLRTQQTAAPLAEAWSSTVGIAPSFGEVPSPATDPGERAAWLASSMVSQWADLGPTVATWRQRLVAAVHTMASDAVVFTHFVAINAVVAEADDRPEVVVFAPANASVTVIEVDAATGGLRVVARGAEATPDVR